jgi:hydrogenase nickel incorporation protein HypA/HybF
MHELGITQSILTIALHHARQANAVRINHVNLVIGELSSIIDDSVQFYWDMLTENTIAHGAVLNFNRVPASLHCRDCDHTFSLDREAYICPACGSSAIQVTGGDEFFMESIDVDTER